MFVLETGYFIGKITRKNTIVVAAEGVMNLSDLKGVVYVSDKNWELDVLGRVSKFDPAA